MREKREKGTQKWSRKFRDILVLIFNMFPRPFSVKDVIKLTGKAENTLRSKSKSAAVHQKETKFDEKGRSTGAIMSRRRCIDHPQKRMVLYLSIDRSRTVASQYDRDRTCELPLEAHHTRWDGATLLHEREIVGCHALLLAALLLSQWLRAACIPPTRLSLWTVCPRGRWIDCMRALLRTGCCFLIPWGRLPIDRLGLKLRLCFLSIEACRPDLLGWGLAWLWCMSIEGGGVGDIVM